MCKGFIRDLFDVLERSFVAVCESFITDSPGFGWVMTAVWPSGEMSMFTRSNGVLTELSDNEKEEVE